MTGPGRHVAPQLLLLSMIAIWGASYASVKTILDHGVPPFVLLAARFWLALACLLPLVCAGGAANLRREAGRGIATGTALLIGYALQTFGMTCTSASMAGFLSGLITLLVALGAFFVFGERLRVPTLAGLALGTAGLALLCFGSGDAGGGDSAFGIGLQIASSTSYAAHILLLSRWSRPGGETAYCWWQLATVAVGVTALLPTGGLGALPDYGTDAVVLGNVAFLGVFATAIGIAVQSRVQPRIAPSRVAVLFATQPGFAALGGAVLLGDRLAPLEWLGGGMIATGVLLASVLRARTAPAAAFADDGAR